MGYRDPDTDNEWTASQLAALAFLVTIIVGLLSYFLLPKETRETVGYSTSIAGFLLGTFGFGLTLWQLGRTQTAAKATNEAVERLRDDVGALDVLSELHRISSDCEAAIEHLKASRWPEACSSYSRIRVSLNRVLTMRGSHDDFDDELAKDYISHLIGASGELEDQGPGGVGFDTSGLRAKLREIQDFVNMNEIKIRGTIGG